MYKTDESKQNSIIRGLNFSLAKGTKSLINTLRKETFFGISISSGCSCNNEIQSLFNYSLSLRAVLRCLVQLNLAILGTRSGYLLRMICNTLSSSNQCN
jgi:hypothetical protein